MALEFSWQLPLCGPSQTPGWAQRPGEWMQLAQAAEYAGLDGLWIPGGAHCADSLGVAAALCAHTRHLQLTVSVPPEVMLPAALAATLQSLQSISSQRVRLHLPDSEQGSLRSAFGEWLNRDQRNERIGEYLEILGPLLQPEGSEFNYDGRYFQLENAGIGRRPLPAPPLILDDSQDAALIARHAQVCLLRSGAPDWLRQAIERLRDDQGRLVFASSFGLIARDTEDEAWDAAERVLQQARLSLPETPAQVLPLKRHRHPARRFEIHPNLWQPHSDQPLCLVGTPHQIATRLQQLHGLGLGQVIIQGEPAVRELLRFGEQILPLLTAQGLRKERC
ncbi:LLM class flavin-dependent oxidoreductase [Pseudomonas vanderleydeniana]|uniref:LLM class flavin-dependent oxidoreductase n=1 Tax=Pseudomonas vanderleydeniana TaxID=2745495 RepID=A0A9E6PR30_9PSED|nr:LLM class flavin-dependent oxidoreductase [Pseudomonas vanderleydeniana]QXI30638.1 LLM class flavin-dependent oxidoreductase [Pseudomonas vanderleydeniana]